MRDEVGVAAVVLVAAVLLVACGGQEASQVTQAPQESNDVSQVDGAGVQATLAEVVSGSPTHGVQVTAGSGEVVQVTPSPAEAATSTATPGDAMSSTDPPIEQAMPAEEAGEDIPPLSGDGSRQAVVPEQSPAAEAVDGLTDDQRWLLESLSSLGPAPELENEVWLNSEPLRLADLRGRVVLLDMWTFG